MEHTGIPLDAPLHGRLSRHWDGIRARLVAQYDPQYQVYDGLRFVTDKFLDYLVREDIPWPTHETGVPDLRDETFKAMSELYPQLAHLHQLRHTMAKLRLNSIVLGADGRNRCMLGQFVCSTGRNAHQAGRSIFGPSRWLRGLIKPPRGRVLAYLDWKSQEFVIAAALSGDQHMLDAIASGDAYLWFAKMSKLAPEWATAETHPQVREICKRCCLGVLYGMGARALALRTKKSEFEARDLLDKHRRIFPTFWAWSCRAVHEATLFGHIDLAFGWRIHDGMGVKPEEETAPPTLMNAPMQGNGAEMMRLAAIFGHRAGITINAPLHDAFMIEAREEDARDAIQTMKACMARASSLVLDGVEVDVDQKVIAWPDRYMDDRVEAKDLWRDAMGHLAAIERETRPTHQCVGTYAVSEGSDPEPTQIRGQVPIIFLITSLFSLKMMGVAMVDVFDQLDGMPKRTRRRSSRRPSPQALKARKLYGPDVRWVQGPLPFTLLGQAFRLHRAAIPVLLAIKREVDIQRWRNPDEPEPEIGRDDGLVRPAGRQSRRAHPRHQSHGGRGSDDCHLVEAPSPQGPPRPGPVRRRQDHGGIEMSTSFTFDVACRVCGTRGTVFWSESGHADRTKRSGGSGGRFARPPSTGSCFARADGRRGVHLLRRSGRVRPSKVASRMHCMPDNAPVELALASTYQTHEPLSGGQVRVRVHHKGEVLIEYTITSRQAALEGHRRIGAAMEARDATRPDQAVLDGPLQERVAG